MFNVNKEGIITLNRGDNFSITIFINKGSKINPIRYILGSKDELYFALMSPNQSFEDALLIKKCNEENLNENGDIIIKFDSKDTEFLIPGKYYYQVKLKISKDNDLYDINTIIPITEFYIER